MAGRAKRGIIGGSDPKRDPKWARPFCTFSSSEKCEELSPFPGALSKVHIARSNIAGSSHAKIEAFPYVPPSCVALLFLENNSKTLSAAIVHSCNIFWLKMTGSRFSKPLGGRKEKRKRERHVVTAGFIRRRTKRRPRKSVRAQFWSVPLFCQWRTRDNNVWLLFGQLQQLNACIVNSEKGKKINKRLFRIRKNKIQMWSGILYKRLGYRIWKLDVC